MNIFEVIGFAIVVLSTGLAAAAFMTLASFGAYVAWKCFIRGAEASADDIDNGKAVDAVILRHRMQKSEAQ